MEFARSLFAKVRSKINLALILIALGCAPIAYQSEATTVVAMNFDTMVNQSSFIVEGDVVDVSSEWSADGATIYTYVTLGSIQVVHGGVTGDSVTLQFEGGRVGDDVITVIGSPTFEVGARELLFVRNNGVAVSPIVGFFQGRFKVIDNAIHDHAGMPIVEIRDNAFVKVATEPTLSRQDLRQKRRSSSPSAGTAAGGTFRYQENDGETELQAGSNTSDNTSRPSTADVTGLIAPDSDAVAPPAPIIKRSGGIGIVENDQPTEIILTAEEDKGDRLSVEDFIAIVKSTLNDQ